MHKNLTLSPIALALLTICPGITNAQEPSASSTVLKVAAVDEIPAKPVIDEITVTGSKLKRRVSSQKTAGNLRDIAQSISIVPESLLETQGAVSLSDALRNVSGLTLASGEGGVTGDSITIRGFSARSDIYQNGSKDNGQFFRDSFNLQQVEVFKGASSMLFGRGGTGGAVNSVTKKAEGKEGFTLALSQASNGGYRMTTDVASADHQGFAWRVAGLIHDQDSFRDDVFVDRKAAAPSLNYKFNEDTSLSLDALTQQETSVLDYGLPYNLATGLPVDVDIRNHYGLGKESFQEYDVTTSAITFNHKFNDSVRLKNTTSSGSYARTYRMVRPNTINEITPNELTMVRRNHAVHGSQQKNIFNQTDFNIDFSSGGMPHVLTTGIEFGEESYLFKSRSGAASGLPNLPDVSLFNPQAISVTIDLSDKNLDSNLTTHRDTQAKTSAVYAVNQTELNERLQLILGLRRDRFDAKMDNLIALNRLGRIDEMNSGRAGLIYQPSEQSSYYLSYGSSFNPSAEGLSLSESNANTDPEETRNSELGARFDSANGKVNLNTAIYRLDKTNARTNDPSNTSVYILDGRERTDGAEIEINSQITTSWFLRGGASWMDARIVESNDVSGGIALEGKRSRNAPKFSASIWTMYSFSKGIDFGLGAFHVSERYADSGNTRTVPDYTRFDAYAGWKLTDLTIALNIYNLSDKRYFEYAHAVFATPGATRSFSLSARMDFK